MTTSIMEPVEMVATVPISKARAFELFTTSLGRWWPLASHSIGQEHAIDCGVEPRVGGDVFELLDDRTRHSWGKVLEWEPPHRFVLSWHPGLDPSLAQQVEVTFRSEGTDTVVTLRHYGWESLGDLAAEMRSGYANGWKTVFGERFVGQAHQESAAGV